MSDEVLINVVEEEIVVSVNVELDTSEVSVLLQEASDGLSAYELAVANGYVGDEASWLASLEGSDANVTNSNVNTAIEEDPAATRTSLGLGSAATTNSGDYATAAQGELADSASQPGHGHTDLVPYTGATAPLELGENPLRVDTITNTANSSLYIDLANSTLNDSGTKKVDWSLGQLNSGDGSSNLLSIDWGNRTLNDTSGTIVYDWSSGVLIGDGTGLTGLLPLAGGTMAGSLDLGGFEVTNVGSLTAVGGMSAVDIIHGGLTDSMTNSVEWINHKLVNTGGIGGVYATALDWNLRTLNNSDGNESYNWSSGIMTGNGSGLTDLVSSQISDATDNGLSYTEKLLKTDSEGRIKLNKLDVDFIQSASGPEGVIAPFGFRASSEDVACLFPTTLTGGTLALTSDIPEPYTLPIAAIGALGGIQSSDDIAVNETTGVATVNTGTSPGAIPRFITDGFLPIGASTIKLGDQGGIDTSDGGGISTSTGGSIDTSGTGIINFGSDGTRTVLTGSATGNVSVSFPDASGTLALTSDIPAAPSSIVGISGTLAEFNDALIDADFATVVDPARTVLTGDGTTTAFAINGAGSLTNPSALIVAIDGAAQSPSNDYTVNNGVITFTSPLANGATAVVVSPFNVLQMAQMTPSDGSVTSNKLDNNINIIGDLSAGGDIEATLNTKGVILRSPNNSRWRITVSNAGTLSATAI